MEEDKYTKVPTTNNRLLRTHAYVLVGGADGDRTYPSAGKAATYDGTPRTAEGPIPAIGRASMYSPSAEERAVFKEQKKKEEFVNKEVQKRRAREASGPSNPPEELRYKITKAQPTAAQLLEGKRARDALKAGRERALAKDRAEKQFMESLGL
jgi:hypothetical protein